jgi:hypothetical protein
LVVSKQVVFVGCFWQPNVEQGLDVMAVIGGAEVRAAIQQETKT